MDLLFLLAAEEAEEHRDRVVEVVVLEVQIDQEDQEVGEEGEGAVRPLDRKLRVVVAEEEEVPREQQELIGLVEVAEVEVP